MTRFRIYLAAVLMMLLVSTVAVRYGLFDFDIVGERLPGRAEDLTAADKSATLYFGDEPLSVKPCNPAKDPLNRAIQAEPCYSFATVQRLGIRGLAARVAEIANKTLTVTGRTCTGAR